MKKSCLASWIILILLGSVSFAQDEDIFKRQWEGYFKKVADGYSIGPDDSDKRFDMLAEPIHRFYNTGSGNYMRGAFFVWTDEGRASAIASLWSFGPLDGGEAMVAHELHSLSPLTLRARRDGVARDWWYPRKAGLDFVQLNDVAAPRQSRGLRLAQMRSIARSFTGFVERNQRDDQLRLLGEPLFRYTENAGRKKVIDGGVFAFFTRWDPEVLLVVEAHELSGKKTWVYSGARMTSVPASLHRDGVEVWKVDWVPTTNEPTEAYHTVHRVDIVSPRALP